jgi:hypothetical protein
MQTKSFEGLLKSATVKAIDGVAKKVGDAESMAEKKIGRLLQKWSDMDAAQKEHVAEIAVATIGAAVTAVMALRKAKKSPIKTAARSLAKRASKK